MEITDHLDLLVSFDLDPIIFWMLPAALPVGVVTAAEDEVGVAELDADWTIESAHAFTLLIGEARAEVDRVTRNCDMIGQDRFNGGR